MILFEKASIKLREVDLIKNLNDFKPGIHKIPKEWNARNDQWVQSIARSAIEEKLNEVAKEIKSALQYKRKDLKPIVIEDGFGELSTADFDYSLQVNQSSDDPKRYEFISAITAIRDKALLEMDNFNACFAKSFNELHLGIETERSVEDFIDFIEDQDDDRIKRLEYEQINPTNCEVYFKDMPASLTFDGTSLILNTFEKCSPVQLLISFEKVHPFVGAEGQLF